MFHRSRLFKRSRKDGTSKYKGVAFNKASNKRHAKVIIDGKNHHIGVYDNGSGCHQYARAVSKYKGGKSIV
jgi:hypothetical protein